MPRHHSVPPPPHHHHGGVHPNGGSALGGHCSREQGRISRCRRFAQQEKGNRKHTYFLENALPKISFDKKKLAEN